MSPDPPPTDLPPDAATSDPATAAPTSGELNSAPRSAHVVIHKLRSPITAILGFAETLARHAERGSLPPEKLIDRLGRIRDSAIRINDLVDELDQLSAQDPHRAK